MAASLLMHCLVLVSLGTVTTRGPALEPGVMITYLAMPSAVAERAPFSTIGGGHEIVQEPVQSQSVKQVPPKPLESVHQLPVETPVLEEKPVTNPGVEPAVDDSDKAALLPAKMDLVKLTANETSIENTAQDVGTKVHDDKIQTRSSQALAVNSQSSILNSQFASALLAFAGDPATLGMLARDALKPDLVKARILFLPEPAYPVLCRRRGEEGRVVIEIEISAKGKVLKAEVANSSSYARLDRAAQKAVKRATFSPAMEFGRPVESQRTVAYVFRLEHK